MAVRAAFLGAYEGTVRAIVDSTHGKDGLPGARGIFGAQGWAKLFKGWEEIFARILREFEMGAVKVSGLEASEKGADEARRTARRVRGWRWRMSRCLVAMSPSPRVRAFTFCSRTALNSRQLLHWRARKVSSTPKR